jgi:outer membrane protein assembly factor BamB
VCGYFQCINGDTGETIWSVPMHEHFGLLSTYGGRTNFPLVFEDLVIISGVIIGWGDMAAPCHRFIAFDKLTGEVVWFNGTRPLPDDTTYSAPSLAVLNGQQAMVAGAGDGSVWAFHVRTGIPMWSFAFSRRGLNVAPVVKDGIIYTGHSEENNIGTAMGAVVAIDGSGQGNISDSGEKWRHFELMMGKCAPLVINDRVYCFDDRAKVFVLDRSTGEQVGRQRSLGTVMRASPLYADGKIFTADQSGRWYILKPEGDSVDIISKGRFRSESVDASPICSHGRVYFTTGGGIYCLTDPQKETGVEPLPPLPKETPVAKDSTPASVQVVPVELLTEPGKQQQFKVRLFNREGQLLKESAAAFTADGPGTISEDGVLTIADDAAHQAVIVSAKVGDLTGRARVRVVPPLPWEFTFDGLSDPPITWVGARVRHVMRDVDGDRVMVKITTIPKGTRSRCWFGPSDLTNYTIQADVRGAISEAKMPDMGLIAQGYTIDLKGAAQQLQIRSWDAQLRMASTIDFAWKPDTWYTMKLKAEVVDGKAILHGKVWPRDEPEPEQWSIKATDETPNLSGSPGLFGNAKDAEIMIDNVKVFAN